MAIEIERKFLVKRELLVLPDEGIPVQQGYLQNSTRKSVRVRVFGGRGFITVKGPDLDGTRMEFEYEIPGSDAESMQLFFCEQPLISKIRYHIHFKGHRWEVDRFLDGNLGLWLAEVELQDRNENVEIPDWIGPEVTADKRYFNTYLSQNPYTTWADKE